VSPETRLPDGDPFKALADLGFSDYEAKAYCALLAQAPANGYQVVGNYPTYGRAMNPDGPNLVVIENGTHGVRPEPGDVVSTAPTKYDPLGHTAVVTASEVDSSGNGTVTLIQENGGWDNDGWVTYPVSAWKVGDHVSGWLHNPTWTVQSPMYGFVRAPSVFASRLAVRGGPFHISASDAQSIAVAGAAGPRAIPLLGYVSTSGTFYADQGSTPDPWIQEATGVRSIALAEGGAGATPALGYVTTDGRFYAEHGPLPGSFTLEASGVRSIAISYGGAHGAPLLAYVDQAGTLRAKTGVTLAAPWVLEATRVRSIALAGSTAVGSEVLGYVSGARRFFVKTGSLTTRWVPEATGVAAISVASLGPAATPLLGYLTTAQDFYAAEGAAPKSWSKLASVATEVAVAAGSGTTATPILAYLSAAGDFEASSRSLVPHFVLQGTGVTQIAAASITYD